MTLSTRDLSIQIAMPVLVAPVAGTLPPVELDQVRHVVCRDGLMVQARTRALSCSALIAEVQDRTLPYGELAEHTTLVGGPLTQGLIESAIALARRALPNEWAGVIVHEGGRYQLLEMKPLEASPGHVRYSSADIDPSTVVIDIHSHGRLRAGFSGTDDADDLAQPSACFLAAVIGNLDQREPSYALRLVINGRFVTLDDGWLA